MYFAQGVQTLHHDYATFIRLSRRLDSEHIKT